MFTKDAETGQSTDHDKTIWDSIWMKHLAYKPIVRGLTLASFNHLILFCDQDSLSNPIQIMLIFNKPCMPAATDLLPVKTK